MEVCTMYKGSMKGSNTMYQIIKDDGRKGYGYVKDYVGNTWFYGTLKECKEFIKEIERSISNANIL